MLQNPAAFTLLCRESGLRTNLYIFSNAFFPLLLFLSSSVNARLKLKRRAGGISESRHREKTEMNMLKRRVADKLFDFLKRAVIPVCVLSLHNRRL